MNVVVVGPVGVERKSADTAFVAKFFFFVVIL